MSRGQPPHNPDYENSRQNNTERHVRHDQDVASRSRREAPHLSEHELRKNKRGGQPMQCDGETIVCRPVIACRNSRGCPRDVRSPVALHRVMNSRRAGSGFRAERTIAIHYLPGEAMISPGQKAKRCRPSLMSTAVLTCSRLSQAHFSDVSLRHVASDANSRDERGNPGNSPIAKRCGGKYRLVNGHHRDIRKHRTLQNHRPDGGRFQIRPGNAHSISVQGGLVIVAHSKACGDIRSYSDRVS
ncbi:hypothetical protein LMG22037_00036 [Paraburkholderia phenoliruptrix]|uniref:Uncharacterized protein n=1 Tax=Paraburkholderia phenoliruptrix TaxID=252970 RepID=A0A6J4ZWQ4_9BURK|nr:hypothetical protein LMG22037_00036 [Paraburkholderia phenoliruptrix]